jgi:hypothetical protein
MSSELNPMRVETHSAELIRRAELHRRAAVPRKIREESGPRRARFGAAILAAGFARTARGVGVAVRIVTPRAARR